MTRFASLLLVLLAPFLVSMSKKKSYSITFHSQASDNELPKSTFPIDLEGQRMVFKIVPELSQVNVAAFHPFPSETNIGKGIALQMDTTGANTLEILTRTRSGEYLLALVDGKPADYVIMDRVISDGLITIWQGVSDEVIKEMEKKIPHIKPGSTISASERIDMLPTTDKEKKKAFDFFKKGQKDKKKGKEEKEPEVLSYPPKPEEEGKDGKKKKKKGDDAAPESLPVRKGAVTSKIPMEGETLPLPTQRPADPLAAPPSQLSVPQSPAQQTPLPPPPFTPGQP